MALFKKIFVASLLVKIILATPIDEVAIKSNPSALEKPSIKPY